MIGSEEGKIRNSAHDLGRGREHEGLTIYCIDHIVSGSSTYRIIGIGNDRWVYGCIGLFTVSLSHCGRLC
jgi:hypothetical protein